MNEEIAVECMKNGANDYVIKEQIKRLPFAVLEAIEKSRVREERENMYMQLQQSLKEYRDLINAMNETVWIIDTDGTLLEVNNTAIRVLGYSREELLKRGLSGIDVKYDKDKIRKMAASLPADKIHLFQTTHKSKKGILIPVEVSSSLIQYGGKTTILSVARDISDRIRAERAQRESEEKYRLIVENANDGIEITQNDKIIFCNSRFAEMLGYSVEELHNMSFSNIFTEEAKKELQIRHQKRLAGETLPGLYSSTFYTKRGDVIDVEVTYEIIDYGGQQATFAIIRDISDLKKAQEELISAKERAEESDRLKSAFLANMSHEIRTPMNGILGFTDLLRNPKLNSEQQRQYIKIIQKSGQRMLNTVNDIIEISKIETGQVQVSKKQVDFHHEIGDLCAFFAREAKNKGLELIFDNPEPNQADTIKTDLNKFTSILSNLIKNAMKFTETGSVHIGYNVRKGEIEFYVDDTGIGIAEERHHAIFDRFVQADISDAQAYQGSGLGLAIAKSYTTLLGGRIGFKSEVGKGSHFYFILPCETANKGEKQRERKENGNMKNKDLNILITEDDETADIYLSIILEDIAGTILHARTGEEAIRLAKAHPELDLILMDIKMPGINGYEASRRIREFNKDVTIVAQTAYAFSGESEKALEAGCDGYISKPVQQEALLKTISDLTENKS
jgi:PAS domain S-box-containing protein